MADVNNKAWRHAVQKNALEQTNYYSTTRNLDAQRRSLSTKMTREEKDVKSQLMRLQGEQRTQDDPTYVPDVETDIDSNAEKTILAQISMSQLFLSEEVINPYPISVKPKIADLSTSSGGDQCEYSDSSSALWVGEPEAISSVRRPQRPPCRQRMDLARTRSLKERPSTARGSSSSDDRDVTRHDSGSSTPRSCSRAGSLKELIGGGLKSGTERGSLIRGGSLKDASSKNSSSSKFKQKECQKKQSFESTSGVGCYVDDNRPGMTDSLHSISSCRHGQLQRYPCVREESRPGDT